VNVPEELAPLGDGHALLQDAGGSALGPEMHVAPAKTQQGDTHPERTLESHRDIHISIQAQSTIHNQATKVWIVEVGD
jgi:hypothetical protein